MSHCLQCLVFAGTHSCSGLKKERMAYSSTFPQQVYCDMYHIEILAGLCC